MSTLQIAEVTGKQHKHVIRDAKAMLTSLYGLENEDGPKLDHLPNGVRIELDARSYIARIDLDETHSVTLVTGYDVPMRKAIVDFWVRTRREVKPNRSPTAAAKPKVYGPAEIRRQWVFAQDVAAAAGLEGNPLLIAANRVVRATTNFDLLGSMGLARLTAEVQDTKVIVSKLAQELEMSARAVNLALEAAGLQTGDRDHKNNRIWKLTSAGKALGGQLTQVARSNDTGQAEQIVWPIEATLVALRAHLDQFG